VYLASGLAREEGGYMEAQAPVITSSLACRVHYTMAMYV
jgi:hypothetical protein